MTDLTICFGGAGNTSAVKNSESTGLEPRNSTASPISETWMHYLGSTYKQMHVQIGGAIFDETQKSHKCEVSALMRWQASGQIQSMWAQSESLRFKWSYIDSILGNRQLKNILASITRKVQTYSKTGVKKKQTAQRASYLGHAHVGFKSEYCYEYLKH